MRSYDKDHFQCPDCSTSLPREMFSCHPAICANKTEPSIPSLVLYEQPREESYGNSDSSKTNKFDAIESDLIQDKSIVNTYEEQAATKNQNIDSPVVAEVKYTCQYCNFYSPYRGTLKVHTKIKHANENSGTSALESASNCLLTFPAPQPYQHPDTSERKQSKWANGSPQTNHNLICTVCGTKFQSKVGLRKHTENKHSNVINFTCNECGQLFARKSRNCHEHLSRTCNLCSKVFHCKDILKDHLNVHSGFKPYQCNEHFIQFYSKKRLREHIYRIHELNHSDKVASHPCAECNKIFMKSYNDCLQHKQSGRNPCAECGKLFMKKYDDCSKHTLNCGNGCGYKTSDKIQLKLHSRSSRCDPNKPFSREYHCTVCKKGFSTDKNQRKHEKIHKDGKPHECNICFIQFTFKHALIKHLRRKHDIEMIWDTRKKEYS